MKVIVRRETREGCPPVMGMYVPEKVNDFESDDCLMALEKLYKRDLDYFGDLTEYKEICPDDLTAHIFTRRYHISYKTTELSFPIVI